MMKLDPDKSYTARFEGKSFNSSLTTGEKYPMMNIHGESFDIIDDDGDIMGCFMNGWIIEEVPAPTDTVVTLRDKFAGDALIGILTSRSGGALYQIEADGTARDSYRLADAMMEARGE